MKSLKPLRVLFVVSIVSALLGSSPVFASNSAKSNLSANKVMVSTKKAVANIVNINTASAEEMQSMLKGVGLKKAQAIVEYREQHGKFKSIEQVKEVKGIGDALFEKIKDYIVI